MLDACRYVLLVQVVIVAVLYFGGVIHAAALLSEYHGADHPLLMRLFIGLLCMTIGGLTSCIGIGAVLIWYWEPELAPWRIPLWEIGILAFFLAWCSIFRFEIHGEIRDDLLSRPGIHELFVIRDCEDKEDKEEKSPPDP